MRNHVRVAVAIAALILAEAAVSLFANDHSSRFDAADLFDLELATDPQISPDGGKIVYVRQFSDIMSDTKFSNLWIIDFDGSDHRPLTSGNYHDSSPRWSADGKQLIYISDRDDSPQIYKMWLSSGQDAKLTNLQNPPAGLAWSPDGKYISFTMLVPDSPYKLADLPTPPKGAEWAEPAKIIDKLTYRWDRVGYIKPGYTQLFVIPSEGGTPRQISSGDYYHGGFGFFGGEAVWTPDSKFLIMSANRKPDFEHDPLDSEVYEFALGDGSVRALTARKGPDNSPVVSPDGKWIAYTGFDDRYRGYQVTRLYVMNRDGSNSRVFTTNLDQGVRSPVWSADGKGVYFLYDDHGNTKLAFISLDGKVRDISRDVGAGLGRPYSGGAYSVARNGNFAMTYSRPDIPGEVAVGSAASTTAKVVTAVNEDVLGHKALGKVEETWYESSLDGRKIQGWILQPPDFDPAKKYPLILEIHGGPFANYGDRFFLEAQVWAANGFVTLYTNPRGSTSYGEEFGNLIHHAYPGDDFYDLNSGVDAVIAKGYIEEDNVFVTGGSGGGVLTCWMIGRSERFRAAASLFPVINWYSFALTADISAFVSKYWFPGMPWDHVEHYEKRSLLSVVKNVKTPTLIMTGEEDYRTPMSESEQYYQALKLLNVESVLVRVPGEPHGVSQRPSHHMAKILYIMNWFQQHMRKT